MKTLTNTIGTTIVNRGSIKMKGVNVMIKLIIRNKKAWVVLEGDYQSTSNRGFWKLLEFYFFKRSVVLL
jgi:hypothetical protein